MAADPIVAALLRVELFQKLRPLQVTEIARQVERVVFRDGDVITKANVAADAAYLVVAGNAQWLEPPTAAVDSNGTTIEVGSLIGEMAMLIDYVYGSTIVAAGTVKCLRISRAHMHALMLDDPGLAEALTQTIARRLSRIAEDLKALDAEIEPLDTGDITTASSRDNGGVFASDHSDGVAALN